MYLYISDNMCLCMSASVSGADPGKPPARSPPVLLRRDVTDVADAGSVFHCVDKGRCAWWCVCV